MEFFTFTQSVDIFFTFAGDLYKDYMWLYFLIGGICFAVVYAFQAIALFRIASREGYDKKWMSFVPFLNTYYIGVVADKNKVYKLKAKHVSLTAAILEFAYVVLSIVYYVAQFLIFDGGYATPEYSLGSYAGVETTYFTGYYILGDLPNGLAWAGWVFAYMDDAFLSWISLLYLVANVFLMIAFFQTYSCRHYVLFSIFAILFPIKGILMFAVRNNSGKNYGQYLREKQQQQYQAYQEYMRRNGGYNNYAPNGQNPYNGGSYYGGNSAPKDPFEGMGNNNSNGGNGNSQSGNSGNGDPFEDL